jgi:LPS sulfotransferase NodH
VRVIRRLPFLVHDFLRAPLWTSRSLAWRALHPDAKLAAPVFLVGAPRSGTTLAVDLLATHPDVANWSEAGRLWDPIDYHNDEADHYFAAERATPAQIARLHRWCEWYRQSHGKARFVNKHPRNSVRIDYLRRVFPDARFIHVVRDGRAVVSSIVTQIRSRARREQQPMGGFCRPPGWRALLRDDLVEQTALQWQAIVRYLRERSAALGPDYCEVRYEELCARPREVYRGLFEFAGLAAGEAQLAGVSDRRLERSDGWRERLSAREIDTVEKTAGDLLTELGYDR